MLRRLQSSDTPDLHEGNTLLNARFPSNAKAQVHGEPTNVHSAEQLLGRSGRASASGGGEPEPSLGQRFLAFVGRHKIATAGALLGANLVANLFGVAPVQFSTTNHPHRPAIRILGAPLIQFPSHTNAPSVLVPATLRPAADSTQAYAYRDAIKSYIADEQAAIAAKGLVLRPDNRSIAMFHDGDAPKGVLVMFHGLDDGPTQWSYKMQRYFDLGYDIFAPNLPGHGILNPDGSANLTLIPGARGYKDWRQFQDRIFDLTRSSGKVSIVGLSAGGLMTLQLAERHAKDLGPDGKPIIQQVVAVDPLLGLAGIFEEGGKKLEWHGLKVTNEEAAEALDTGQAFLGKRVDNYLLQKMVDMKKTDNPKTAYGTRYINQDDVLGLIINADKTIADYRDLKALPNGLLIIQTDADQTVDAATSERFARKAGATLFTFPAWMNVPHAVVSPLENPDLASVDRVSDLIAERLSR
jgi:alpha-beta hydrolase superfamily lysophospholipase